MQGAPKSALVYGSRPFFRVPGIPVPRYIAVFYCKVRGLSRGCPVLMQRDDA